MKNKLTKQFTLGVLSAATAAAVLCAGAGALDLSGYGVNEQEWEVLKLTNMVRAEVSVPPLSLTTALQDIAAIRADELKVVFSHDRPDGSGYDTAFEGLNWSSMGENIAVGFPDAYSVVAAWYNSEGHYYNMVNGNFTHLGVGFANNYWTQDFLGHCQARPESLYATYDTLIVGQEPEDMDGVILMSCAEHGDSLLPLTNSICTSYEVNEDNTSAEIAFMSASGEYAVIVPMSPFTDIVGHWGYDYILDAYKSGLMTGMGGNQFAPNGTTSRAMVVTILYRMAQESVVYESSFTDVPGGQWYSEPITWAAQSGVSNGMGGGLFGIDNNVSRQDLAVFLWRYAGSPASDASTAAFSDAHLVSDYARTAISWCVEQGIMSGNADGTLNPQGTATRGESAKMFTVFSSLMVD